MPTVVYPVASSAPRVQPHKGSRRQFTKSPVNHSPESKSRSVKRLVARDKELEAAILGHDHVEPLRWSKPNVVVLEKHEYYEKLKPTTIGDTKFESIHSFDRLYQIIVTIGPDGKATTAWKLRADR